MKAGMAEESPLPLMLLLLSAAYSYYSFTVKDFERCVFGLDRFFVTENSTCEGGERGVQSICDQVRLCMHTHLMRAPSRLAA